LLRPALALDSLVQQRGEPIPLLTIEREDTTVGEDMLGTLRQRRKSLPPGGWLAKAGCV